LFPPSPPSLPSFHTDGCSRLSGRRRTFRPLLCPPTHWERPNRVALIQLPPSFSPSMSSFYRTHRKNVYSSPGPWPRNDMTTSRHLFQSVAPFTCGPSDVVYTPQKKSRFPFPRVVGMRFGTKRLPFFPHSRRAGGILSALLLVGWCF